MTNGKVKNHKHNIISQLLHPSEYLLGLKMKDDRKGLLNISAPMGAKYEDILNCEKMLNEISGNMSLVIKELPDCLRLPVALFYLYYKAILIIYDLNLECLENFNDYITTDISNNIIPTPLDVKRELLLDFYKYLSNDKENIFEKIDAYNESYNELLSNIGVINNVFKTIPEYHQDIVKKTIQKIGQGLAEYSMRDLTSGTEDRSDFEGYCFAVAGQLGSGLTQQFVGALNTEANNFTSDDEHLSAKMGHFLKKTNLIRDYYKDLLDNKSYWPKEVWSLYRKTLPELRFGESSDVACLNHMITDALEDIPYCLEYLSKIENPNVFRFCAIPQIRALALLAEAYGNRNVFTGIIEIRKGLYASILNSSNNIEDVKKWYKKFASQILDKVNKNDPNSTRILEILNQLKAEKNFIPYHFQEVVSIICILSVVFIVFSCIMYVRPSFTVVDGAVAFRLTKPPE